ncbi:MAG TPA: LysR family transcriptional regulator [Geminicoccaceae bacterium]|nr:LysR family transcriptional regulator [Geminicoccaceae bacterium]
MQQVRYFVVLTETLNFTRAAERCNVTQPSLTRAIKLLEDELGGPLFHRERNNTHLTDLGRQVEPHLRRVMEEVDGARARAVAIARLQQVELRLGIAAGVGLAPFARLIGRFCAAHPTARIVLPCAGTEQLLESLRQGELEIVVVVHEPAEPDDLHYFRLGEDAPRLALALDHRLAALDAIPLEELEGETLVAVEGCHRWASVEARLRERNLALQPRLVVGRQQWLLDLARAGLGIGLVAADLEPGPGLCRRPLVDFGAARPVLLATKRGRLYSPPVKSFVELALTPTRSAAAA